MFSNIHLVSNDISSCILFSINLCSPAGFTDRQGVSQAAVLGTPTSEFGQLYLRRWPRTAKGTIFFKIENYNL